MKLSKASTTNILNMQKTKTPLIHCITDLVTLNDLQQAIMCYGGRAIMSHGIEEVYEITSNSDALLIGIGTLDNNKILAMEKSLKAAKRKNISTVLDITGADISLYRRNLVLSLLNRYSIDILKGTDNEINAIVQAQKRHKYTDSDLELDYRSFARKNKVVLVISEKKCYITDGYSEFIINNGNDKFNKITSIESMFSGMLAVAIAACESREEKIQGELIATLAFRICEELVTEANPEEKGVIFLKSYLLDEISKIDVDKIEEYGKIIYEFKR